MAMKMRTYNILMTIILTIYVISSWNDIVAARGALIIVSIMFLLLSQLTNHFEKMATKNDVSKQKEVTE